MNAPGDFAQAYVIAHEVAHHVQKLTGFWHSVCIRRWLNFRVFHQLANHAMCSKNLQQRVSDRRLLSRCWGGISLGLIPLLVLSTAWIEKRAHAQSPDVHEADASNIAFPFIVHIPNRLIDFSSSDIHHVTDVDTCILGVRNIGSADLRATESSTFVDSNGHAKLLVRLKGELEARTTGKEGPITIHNRCKMQFDFTVPIRIDEVDGFAAGKPEGTVTRIASNKSLSTHLPGIRGRIAKRIARRKMQETEELANRISLQNTRQQLTQHIAKRVEKQIDDANQKWARLRSTLEHPVIQDEVPKVMFASRKGQLIIFVADFVDGEFVDGQKCPNGPCDIPNDLPAINDDAIVQISIRKDWVHEQLSLNVIVGALASSPISITSLLNLRSRLKVTPSLHSSWYSFSLRITN